MRFVDGEDTVRGKSRQVGVYFFNHFLDFRHARLSAARIPEIYEDIAIHDKRPERDRPALKGGQLALGVDAPILPPLGRAPRLRPQRSRPSSSVAKSLKPDKPLSSIRPPKTGADTFPALPGAPVPVSVNPHSQDKETWTRSAITFLRPLRRC